MITVSELIDILTKEISKDISVLNCGVQIDDYNLKVRFVHPNQKEPQEHGNGKWQQDTGQKAAAPYDHWKEVKV